MIRIKRPRAIVLDIEGTTTSATYYPSAVAPYIRNNMENYLRAHWNEEHVQSIVRDLRQQSLATNSQMPKIADSNQMYIWLDGQMKGLLKTHVYCDVVEAMYKWKIEERIPIYIYSSARADVQMLMFACTEYGSLLHLIDGHFDSKIGVKTATDTYHRIAQSIQQPPQNIAFFTDDPKEARSAKSVGCRVFLLKRERKTFSPIESSQFDVINAFDRVKFQD